MLFLQNSTRSRSNPVKHSGSAIVGAPFAFLAVFFLAGCNPTPRAPKLVKGEVRLSALIRLHPGYADLAVENADPTNRLGEVPQTLQKDASIKMEPLLPTIAPVTLEGSANFTSDASVNNLSIETLRRSYEQHNRARLSQEQNFLLRQMAADLELQREKLLLVPKPQLPEKDVQPIRKQLRQLVLEQIALESAIRVMTLPGVVTKSERLAVVNREIDQLRVKLRPDLTPETANEIDSTIAEMKKARLAEINDGLSKRRISLNRETETFLANMKSRLDSASKQTQRVEPVEPSPAMNMPHRRVVQTETALPVLLQSPTIPLLPANSERRKQMIAFITSDLKRRVDRIAQKNNWKITYVEKVTGQDLTQRVADLLSADFSGKVLAE